MNLILEYLIPVIIIIIANIFSYEHGSRKYEIVTAVFGWAGVAFLILYIAIFFISVFIHSEVLENIEKIFLQVLLFSLITALSRDYEKILKPNAKYFEEKISKFISFFK